MGGYSPLQSLITTLGQPPSSRQTSATSLPNIRSGCGGYLNRHCRGDAGIGEPEYSPDGRLKGARGEQCAEDAGFV